MEKELFQQKIKDIVLQENADAKVILYGSRARGSALQESDWDILVLLNKSNVSFKDEQKIRHKLFDIELETGETISTFVYAQKDWDTRLSVTPLFKNVQKEGIYL
jgi:predicted nucleotidyltransferase